MGFREEVEDLKGQIRKSVAVNDKEQVGELLKQAFTLCETIRDVLQTSNEVEKKAMTGIMGDFKLFLAEESGKLSKKMGLTEEQLANYNENPENFSKEQWMVMQAIKKRFSAKTKEIRNVIKKTNPPSSFLDKIPGMPENWKEMIENNPNITSISPSLSSLSSGS